MNLHHLVSIFNIYIRAYVYLYAKVYYFSHICCMPSLSKVLHANLSVSSNSLKDFLKATHPGLVSKPGCTKCSRWLLSQICTSKIMGGGFWTSQFRRTLRGCESSALAERGHNVIPIFKNWSLESLTKRKRSCGFGAEPLHFLEEF